MLVDVQPSDLPPSESSYLDRICILRKIRFCLVFPLLESILHTRWLERGVLFFSVMAMEMLLESLEVKGSVVLVTTVKVVVAMVEGHLSIVWIRSSFHVILVKFVNFALRNDFHSVEDCY